MTKPGLPRVRERPIHLAVLGLLRLRLPRVSAATIHHSAGEVDVSSKAVARAIAKSKHMGMLVGWPDLTWLGSGGVLHAFEVKTPQGRMSPAQEAVRGAIEAAGGRYAVVRSVDEADAALKAWEAAR